MQMKAKRSGCRGQKSQNRNKPWKLLTTNEKENKKEEDNVVRLDNALQGGLTWMVVLLPAAPGQNPWQTRNPPLTPRRVFFFSPRSITPVYDCLIALMTWGQGKVTKSETAQSTWSRFASGYRQEFHLV
ncbi:hypothetical protein OUZ56_025406 [Daphnia magna]|uniref:Uncharacterized protein n=1 Tax=Daphnia magna TaxID=35525 RepID=A0ABQ9ZJR6_9CRUS|nr:hypothetical protein OUZ56_025406 [Daphnia magna]